MKQKDIALIIVCSVIGAVFSFLISGLVIGTPETRKEQVEIIDPITANFDSVDKRYFNDQAINPTQIIDIGNNTNPTPFNASVAQ